MCGNNVLNSNSNSISKLQNVWASKSAKGEEPDSRPEQFSSLALRTLAQIARREQDGQVVRCRQFFPAEEPEGTERLPYCSGA